MIDSDAQQDLTNVGLSAEAHSEMQRLKAAGVFGEMVEAYRLGVALAIAQRVEPRVVSQRVNVFGVATADPNGLLRTAIVTKYPERDTTPYRLMERLASWGVVELGRRETAGTIDLGDVEALRDGTT